MRKSGAHPEAHFAGVEIEGATILVSSARDGYANADAAVALRCRRDRRDDLLTSCDHFGRLGNSDLIWTVGDNGQHRACALRVWSSGALCVMGTWLNTEIGRPKRVRSKRADGHDHRGECQ